MNTSPSAILDLNCRSLPDLLNVPNIVPSSLNIISPPPASNVISAPTSNEKAPASEIVDPLIVISSTTRQVRPVTSPSRFNVTLPEDPPPLRLVPAVTPVISPAQVV